MSTLKEKKSMKALVLSIGMVVIGIVFFSIVFLYVSNMGRGVVNADELKEVRSLSAQEVEKKSSNLKIRINYNDLKVPQNAVSPQYAAALATELTGKVYQKAPTGKVVIDLLEPSDFMYGDYPAWGVYVEVDGGFIRYVVHATRGIDLQSDYCKGADEADTFTYFWKEATDNDKEIPFVNSEYQDKLPAAVAGPEDAVKRPLAEEYIASHKNLPHSSKALKLVEKTGLANDSTPVSAQVVTADADEGDETYYLVEVKLRNKKSLILQMAADSMDLLGYERYEQNYLDASYPR